MKRLAVIAIAAALAAWSARAPRPDASQLCARNVKTLAGAWEMYALDK
jgi:hypothetical protein